MPYKTTGRILEDTEKTGKYKIEVEFSGIEYDCEITVSPFNSRQEQILSEHISFQDLDILQLSEFYEITAKAGEDIIHRIIMIPTNRFPRGQRKCCSKQCCKG